MSEVHFHKTTTLSPEQFVAGLTDFGPDREKVFSKNADDYLKVHDLGLAEADVTEGSGGVWSACNTTRPRRSRTPGMPWSATSDVLNGGSKRPGIPDH